MKGSTAVELLAVSWAGVGAALDYNAPPGNLSTLPNSTLFETWRPKIHVLPPTGQVGDPCAHYSDPETGLFHVGYLHNGSGIATVQTDDLVHYYDVNKNGNFSLTPGGANDPVSVFDGSVIPSGVDGKPTMIYTSVSSLPIHWTLPYTRGSESQSLAVTSDGKNFTKFDIPPVIPGPPAGLDVTAFRDPFVFQNKELDRTLNSAKGTWYVTISGGVHDVGPSIFLYRSKSSNFEQWEYLGEWFNAPSNSTWGNGDWAGVYGFNWETVNVFGLDKQGYNYNGDSFMTFGVEGSYMPIQKAVSSLHAQLWAAGSVSTVDGNVTFNPNMVGFLDWGLSAYAAAGKVLPSTSKASSRSGAPDRFISYVWLTGDVFEAVKDFPKAQQGWQSTLLLPRELSVHTIPNVVNNDLVHETASWRVASNSSAGSCVELETLGVNIARETYNAITAAPSFSEPSRKLSKAGIVPFNRSPDSKFFVLNAQISFPQSARGSGLKSGFQILSSELESTTIYYQFSNESIVIDRYNTSAASQTTSGINSDPESGRLRLFDINNSCNGSGKDKNEHMETLDLTIVVDNSVLEVYANSRFALSTWARSWYANSTEIRFFHDGEGETSFSNIQVSDGLYDAYPERLR
ncbi:glycoside hydrolase family 32 protein [Aspergillus ruber CBS 135680]|uniref:Arabinanase/levansucrase/invertase n=1 Tax=Aspergillus ruber (strain CBS 135680) TaxID=1388766 RepID=A0A017SAC8_ASPRC|nr:Arabinanase/levansucrase/invertase [Aspergillus ruber CBS 135680]EYE93569.1 Arabinanase/levansucrase/invertase [Aspergillus ruber CBS 135680]